MFALKYFCFLLIFSVCSGNTYRMMQRVLQDIQVHVRSLWPDGILGFHGKILVVGWEWGAGRKCCRGGPCEKTPWSHWIEPVSTGSKRGPPQAKAETMGNTCCTSKITYLIKAGKCHAAAVRENKIVRETTLQTSRSVRKEDVLQAPEERFLCSSYRGLWE